LSLGENNWVDDLAVRDGYAYLAAEDAGFVVIDYSQPAALRQVASFPFDGATDIALDRNLALVATHNSGYFNFDTMEIFDISAPEIPRYLGSVPGFQNSIFASVAADAGIACLGTANRLLIVDLSDPEHPRETAAPAVNSEYSYFPDLAISNGMLFAADPMEGGVLIFDISDPTQPRLLNRIGSAPSYTVDVDGDLLYFSSAGNMVSAADISDPMQPVIHSLTALRGSWALTPKDGWLFLASPPSIEVMSLDCLPPGASFEAEISGSLVRFINTSTSWWDEIHWDFGDGSSVDGFRDIEHRYDAPGVYEVTLEISSDSGDSSSRQSITIENIPKQPLSREQGAER